MKINCYLWQKQNRPIIIINLASLEIQPVSNRVDKRTILKQVGAILKEDANTIVKETSGVFWALSMLKILENPSRSFWTFIYMLYSMNIHIRVVHLIPLIY